MKKLIIEIPSDANEIIHTLQDNGYEAFLVGGCVRDSIPGRSIHDYDITTSATPNEIMKRLRFDNDTREKVVELVYYHDATFEVGKKYVKRWLNKIREEQFRRLLNVRRADIKA